MLIKKVISVLILSVLALFTNAQESIKKIKLTEVSLIPSVFSESNLNAGIADFNSLAPDSKLLPTNYDGYNTSDSYNSSGGFNTSFLLGFKFGKKDGTGYKPNPILRVGLTYTYAQNISSFAYREDKFAHDTLISTSTGEKIAVDSVTNSGYDMQYYSQQLKLDVSLLYQTNPENRWVLFAGVGATFGGSINAQTQIHKYEQNYIQPSNSSSTTYYNVFPDYESENVTNQNNMVFSGYIPLGLDFRIANKNEFWRQVHLFTEMRPSINVTSIPELRTFTNPAFQMGLGMKVQW